MPKIRKVQAFRVRHYNEELQQPLGWKLRHESRAVFHQIDPKGQVQTPDGLMESFDIKGKVNLYDPNQDLAVLVATVPLTTKGGRPDPNSPELWFWNDCFWIKAADANGLPYYGRDRLYVMYPVEVKNSDELLASIKTQFSEEEEQVE